MDEKLANNSDIPAEKQGRKPDRQTQPVDTEAPPRLPFPVVGIGASAGGLEAISDFLSAVGADSGMAYVFIQHLPATANSMLADILSRRTPLPVAQVADQMNVEANHVYVIRPGHTLVIRDGKFHLGQRTADPMHSRPVDDFFKSLAEEQRERAICIVMAGMGSNGSAGAQAVKAVGGLCIAQDPETTQFPSMPRNLIEMGYADYILAPRDIPDVLREYAQHPYASGQRETKASSNNDDQQHLNEILAVLRTRTKQNFSGYKKPTVLRRVQRRMGLTRTNRISDYARLLRQNAVEVSALADDLLIHVTGFFRDPGAWEALRRQVIVPLVARRLENESIRCWVTACSSGEEAYTLAMLLQEEAERINKSLEIKIFATDMAERMLQHARDGLYPGGIEAEITPERLERFFQKDDSLYRVHPDLREMVIFAPQNVLQDPPFSRLDIITCRNLLIYLEPEMQSRILGLVHFGLRDGGALFLGTSETAAPVDGLFEPIDKKARIYRRVGPTQIGSVDFTMPHVPDAKDLAHRPISQAAARLTMAQMTNRALLRYHTSPAVTVDEEMRIAFYHGDTELFLNTPRGEPTRDLFALAKPELRGLLRRAIHQAGQENRAVTLADGWIETDGNRRFRVGVTVSPLDASVSGFLLVSFQNLGQMTAIEKPAAVETGREEENEELRRVRDELQSTIEELQTSNEELKVSHEEVVSANEELQSSNEELETSREEMQSLNEELSTVNTQLHAKMEEHQAVNNDLASLLASIDIAVLFLDREFTIRRFTPQVRELFEMIPADVGRPLSDLSRKFTDPALMEDARAVLDKLVPTERTIKVGADQWYRRRITPYRSADNKIDGVVITFMDVTDRHRAQEAVRISEEQFHRAIQDAPIPMIMQAEDGTVLHISRTWTELTGYALSELRTMDAWLSLAYGEGAEAVREHMQELFKGDLPSLNVEFQIRARDGSVRRWSFSASSPGVLQSGQRFIIGMAVDITDLSREQVALRESEERFRLLVEGAPDFAMIMMGPEGKITAWNTGAERLLGYAENEVIGREGEMIFTPEDRTIGVPQQEMKQALQTGRAQDERWHIRKDGTRFWGSGVLTVLRRSGGEVRGFVKIMRDRTEEKQAEQALATARDAAEQANQVKDEFLATLSHELRTPLSVILLWARMLQESDLSQSPQDLREGLAAIQRSAEGQKELIEDLLDVTRIATGKMRLKIEETDLAALVRSAVGTIMPEAKIRKVNVLTDLDPAVGTVAVDTDRLRQVIWNLLTNAVKFTPAGGRVKIKLSRPDDQIEIRISDTGKGIGPEFMQHLFERFRQADATPSRHYGGMGLGLAISKQLVEMHGGNIAAESAGENKGATFIVRLPERHVPDNEANKSSPPAQIDSATLRGKRVLLVEDDHATRTAMARLLCQFGLRVTEADSAAAGLKAFRASRPDAIISDIGMPGGDGFSLMREIRKIESTGKRPPVPAVALTAYARPADEQTAVAAGFHRHIPKPIEIKILLDTLCQLTEMS